MARLIPIELDGLTIFAQPLESESQEVTAPNDVPQVEQTGVVDKVEDAYAQAKQAVVRIAADLSGTFGSMPADERPTEMEVEFAIAFSAQAGAWIVGASNTTGFKVRLSWKN